MRTRNRKPFRRAGIAFGAEWTELPFDQLTADQAAAIEAETMLEVVRASAPAALVVRQAHHEGST